MKEALGPNMEWNPNRTLNVTLTINLSLTLHIIIGAGRADGVIYYAVGKDIRSKPAPVLDHCDLDQVR